MTEYQVLRKILIELRVANLLAIGNGLSMGHILERYRQKAKDEIATELFEEMMDE